MRAFARAILHKDPKTVYLNIKSWLKEIKATIIEEEQFKHIKADHEKRLNYDEVNDPRGKILHRPKTNWSKRFQFTIRENESSTIVDITINPPYEKKEWHDYSERRNIWLKLVGDLA